MTNLKDQMATDSEATPEVDEGALSTLMSLAEEMERLKEIIDEQDQELKDLRKRYDEVRKVLIPEEMERVKLVNASGKGSFTLSSGAKIHLASDMYAGYLKANEASAFEWLRGEGHGLGEGRVGMNRERQILGVGA